MTDIDVTLPTGWFPLGPVPGLLLAAVRPDRHGHAEATLVVVMHRVPQLTDAEAARAALPGGPRHMRRGAREVRWCAPEVVAVLAATAAVGAAVSTAELADALRQTAVYAVDSTGRAIRSSSAADANPACRGSTRTV